ncbi:MAG TPA: response regulator transcription factor [Rubrobacteraceae bacterium]|nr:response regulator transcription factor [Rubrobacteraceae bacterium]
MNTTEALLDYFVEEGVEEPDEQEPVGTIWIKDSASSVALVRLERALGLRNLRVHRGEDLPEEPPCVVVCCVNCGEPTEAASAVAQARTLAPKAAVLSFGPALDLGVVRAVVKAGAKGFLLTSMPSQQLIRAVSVAAEGEIVLPRALLEMVVEAERCPDLDKLRPRHRELLELISEGLSNAQIAKRLYIAESTVKQHLRSLYKVLGVKNRHEASRILWRADHTGTAGRFTKSA